MVEPCSAQALDSVVIEHFMQVEPADLGADVLGQKNDVKSGSNGNVHGTSSVVFLIVIGRRDPKTGPISAVCKARALDRIGQPQQDEFQLGARRGDSRRSMSMTGIGHMLSVTGLILAVSLPAAAQSQTDYPNRPIRIVVSVPAGGGVDLSARIIASHLQQLWGQPVTVENRTGGSGNIAGEAVWRAAPDGYTLLATPPNILTANTALFKKLNYDPATLTPVAVMALGPNVLAVKNASPAKTVPELIALAKANPGKLSYGSQGNGSTSHLTFELFKSRTGIEVNHVPYRGAAPAVNDLAGGHVDTMFCDLGTILPLHRANRVRIIAAATAKRIAQLSDLPTIDEAGLPGFNSTTFFALMAPPATPLAIRNKLNTTIIGAMRTPEAQEKLKAIFVESSDLEVAAMDAFVKAEAKLWGDVIRAARITVEQ
jgi:tripartite-type tricarboxylate transporter receptor subunit TctC